MHRLAWRTAGSLVGAVSLLAVGVQSGLAAPAEGGEDNAQAGEYATATPIEHLVVIFDENISFDHYFGTYPNAANKNGADWHAAADTPTVNGLTATLLHHNPNKMNPERLGPTQAYTCDQDHSYDAEQKAFNGGLMNKFVGNTGRHDCGSKQYDAPGLVMDYYDGDTVTALWTYAQHFAMSDNSYGSNFGPSTPGAINLISGNTHGAVATDKDGNHVIHLSDIASPDDNRVGTLVHDPDPDPRYDACASGGKYSAIFKARNIGNLLNAEDVTWGWFSGGFRPTRRGDDGQPVCDGQHENVAGVEIADYIPHHEPFQYYKSTANPKHMPPSSVDAIGHTDQANHQYDLSDFYKALDNQNLPAVSFVKAPSYEDGHAGYSDPIDEQHFLVKAINRIQQSDAWEHTAIIIGYDDSDGWYDHAMGPIINPSHDPRQDWLNGNGNCGEGRPMQGYQDRCGYGPRLPLLALSPYAKENYVDHALTDQTSILRFIEDNWLDGQRIGDGSYDHVAGSLEGMFDWDNPDPRKVILNACTGEMRHAQQEPDHDRQQSDECDWPTQAGVRNSY